MLVEVIARIGAWITTTADRIFDRIEEIENEIEKRKNP